MWDVNMTRRVASVMSSWVKNNPMRLTFGQVLPLINRAWTSTLQSDSMYRTFMVNILEGVAHMTPQLKVQHLQLMFYLKPVVKALVAPLLHRYITSTDPFDNPLPQESKYAIEETLRWGREIPPPFLKLLSKFLIRVSDMVSQHDLQLAYDMLAERDENSSRTITLSRATLHRIIGGCGGKAEELQKLITQDEREQIIEDMKFVTKYWSRSELRRLSTVQLVAARQAYDPEDDDLVKLKKLLIYKYGLLRVEYDAEKLWAGTLAAIRKALGQSTVPARWQKKLPPSTEPPAVNDMIVVGTQEMVVVQWVGPYMIVKFNDVISAYRWHQGKVSLYVFPGKGHPITIKKQKIKIRKSQLKADDQVRQYFVLYKDSTIDNYIWKSRNITGQAARDLIDTEGHYAVWGYDNKTRTIRTHTNPDTPQKLIQSSPWSVAQQKATGWQKQVQQNYPQVQFRWEVMTEEDGILLLDFNPPVVSNEWVINPPPFNWVKIQVPDPRREEHVTAIIAALKRAAPSVSLRVWETLPLTELKSIYKRKAYPSNYATRAGFVIPPVKESLYPLEKEIKPHQWESISHFSHRTLVNIESPLEGYHNLLAIPTGHHGTAYEDEVELLSSLRDDICGRDESHMIWEKLADLRVMTYNVHNWTRVCSPATRLSDLPALQPLIQFVKANHVDVLMLQEVTAFYPPGVTQPDAMRKYNMELLRAFGFKYIRAGDTRNDKQFYQICNVTLSKYPIKRTINFPLSTADHRAALCCVIETQQTPVITLNTQLSFANEWYTSCFRSLAQLIQQLNASKLPLLVGGDFNRARYKKILNPFLECDLVTYRAPRKTMTGFQRCAHLDGFLYNRTFSRHFVGVQAFPVILPFSDHFPVIIDFEAGQENITPTRWSHIFYSGCSYRRLLFDKSPSGTTYPTRCVSLDPDAKKVKKKSKSKKVKNAGVPHKAVTPRKAGTLENVNVARDDTMVLWPPIVHNSDGSVMMDLDQWVLPGLGNVGTDIDMEFSGVNNFDPSPGMFTPPITPPISPKHSPTFVSDRPQITLVYPEGQTVRHTATCEKMMLEKPGGTVEMKLDAPLGKGANGAVYRA